LSRGRSAVPTISSDGTAPVRYFCDGRTVIWEYPREAPEGDQVDIVEVIDLDGEKIRHHRIYWGWFGARLLRR